jgi:hypothetical protein
VGSYRENLIKGMFIGVWFTEISKEIIFVDCIALLTLNTYYP